MPRALKFFVGGIQFILVTLPSWFLLFWSRDIAVVASSDVFLGVAVQIVFIGLYIGYIHWEPEAKRVST